MGGGGREERERDVEKKRYEEKERRGGGMEMHNCRRRSNEDSLDIRERKRLNFSFEKLKNGYVYIMRLSLCMKRKERNNSHTL